MAKLSIKNTGPLKEINIKLNRVNVLIGPQSSGKSTVAKLISFFNWLEKDCVLHQNIDRINRQFLEEKFISYHNLQGYFSSLSEIYYEGDAIIVELRDLVDFSAGSIKVKKADSFSKVELSKNAYIPSERNMLALPGIFSIKMPPNYLLEFIDDWQEIRQKYSGDAQLSLLNLGDTYFFNEKENVDKIILKDGKDISFSQASSGLQSVTPLCVCIDYLTQWIYANEENRSAEERKRYRDMMQGRLASNYEKFVEEQVGEEGMAKLQERLTHESSEDILKDFHISMHQMFKDGRMPKDITSVPKEYLYMMFSLAQNFHIQYKLTHPCATNLVVEEPEQNLFPETQVRLMYYILSKLEHKIERDSLVLTTHSPYILYALNNCMMAALAASRNTELIEHITNVPKEAWINPNIVSVWELDNGALRGNKTIQDDRGLIRGNYFDRIMRNVMADFNNIANFI